MIRFAGYDLHDIAINFNDIVFYLYSEGTDCINKIVVNDVDKYWSIYDFKIYYMGRLQENSIEKDFREYLYS